MIWLFLVYSSASFIRVHLLCSTVDQSSLWHAHRNKNKCNSKSIVNQWCTRHALPHPYRNQYAHDFVAIDDDLTRSRRCWTIIIGETITNWQNCINKNNTPTSIYVLFWNVMGKFCETNENKRRSFLFIIYLLRNIFFKFLLDFLFYCFDRNSAYCIVCFLFCWLVDMR